MLLLPETLRLQRRFRRLCSGLGVLAGVVLLVASLQTAAGGHINGWSDLGEFFGSLALATAAMLVGWSWSE